ncbi:MAG: arginyltransferase, partial [Gammaproteobacteria bacterium]|nr:arginyltransferase [Gammaproteobacteria bacterium]
LSSTLFADPDARMNMQTYSALALHGFRRSGENVYRPQCEHCDECVPIRVVVDAFKASRSQKRTWTRNSDLQVQQVAPVYNEKHFELYKRYIATRHSSGEMAYDDPAQYMSFLTSDWAQTVFIEFWLEQKLVAVAIVDELQSGLSAVYSFFDPDLPQRSLGVYAVLWEIEEARRRKLPWVFLGYWIKDCKKMSYKAQYRPAEGFRHAIWEALDI